MHKQARPAAGHHPKRSARSAAKHAVKHHELTDFYTAQQKREMESDKLEAEMVEHLKKLRKDPR